MAVGVVKLTRKHFTKRMSVSGLCCAPGIKSTLSSPTEAPAKTEIFLRVLVSCWRRNRFLVVKSNQAHRASFDPVVAGTIELDTPGVSTVNYANLPYRYLRRRSGPSMRRCTGRRLRSVLGRICNQFRLLRNEKLH